MHENLSELFWGAFARIRLSGVLRREEFVERVLQVAVSALSVVSCVLFVLLCKNFSETDR